MEGNGGRGWSGAATIAIATAALLSSLLILNGQTNSRIDATRTELLQEIRAVRAEIRELR